MDFIEGETLEDHLCTVPGGYLPVEEVLRIGIELCTVLDYLHTRQPPIIFRDLKPDNIMMTSNGHLYLIDFGIARHFKPGQARDTIAFGSPGYAAPEQYGKAQTTTRADVYSLGATLHRLLTGDDPAQTPFHFAPLQLRSQTTPEGLDTLIMQMLELDERRRPASMASVKQNLQGFAAQMTARKKTISQAGVPFLYTPAVLHRTFVPSSLPLEGPVSLGITLYTYYGHTNAVRGIAWSPDSQRLASASNDQTIHVWDPSTGDHFFTYTGHTDAVRAVAWSPNGKYIASASNDHTVQVWDASTGDHLFTYRGHSERVSALAWSPDSRCLASASDDKTVRVWDALTGDHIFSYRGHSDWVRAVAWSPDSKRLASAGDDQTVHVWNITPKHSGLNTFMKSSYHGHKQWVRAVAWSPDSKQLASAGDDQTVHIWSGAGKNHVVIYQKHTDGVYSIGWSPTGKHLVSGSGSCKSYEADNMVRIWKTSTGDTLYTYKGHLDVVYAVAWSPDGSRIASGGKDNTVQVWQAL
jgi:WD40 repeat protein